MKLAVAWGSLGSTSTAPSPLCLCSGSCFILFAVTFSFKSSLTQLLGKLQQSVSARLRSADVACRRYRPRPVLERKHVAMSPGAKMQDLYVQHIMLLKLNFKHVAYSAIVKIQKPKSTIARCSASEMLLVGHEVAWKIEQDSAAHTTFKRCAQCNSSHYT